MELADGLDAGGEAGVNHVAVLGDDLVAEGDSVEVFRVDGDELRGRICLQGFWLCEFDSYTRMYMCMYSTLRV